LIPNFNSVRNPFNTKNLPSQEQSSPVTGVTAKAASTQAAPSSSVSFQEAARIRTGQWGLRIGGFLREVAARTQALGLQTFQWIGRQPAAWSARFRSGRSVARVTGPAERLSGGAVQGELSLENVRVVRNDLTDTDYEVVCSETATASPVRRVSRPAPAPTPAPAEARPLGRLAEKLFSQKTQ
jgi:hypothetical protein